MPFVFVSLIFLTALSAYAADYTAGTKCPAKVNHEPMENLEYEAGVNASGYAVAPADELPAPISAEDFDKINLPLAMPVQDFVDNNQANAAFPNYNIERMELNAGQVQIDTKKGKVSFNGRDISTAEPTVANPDCW
jgi:hypothetical protein